MPRGDGSGPMGMGPRTGRGVGFCAGSTAPGYMSAGFGYGRGRGFRRMSYPAWKQGYAPGTYAVDEKELLKKQAQSLESQLNQIRDRLNALEK